MSYNADIRRRGGQLHIFPGLRNNAPWQHCLNGRAQKTIRLGNGPLQIELIAPQSHQLDQYLSSYPLYDRRLPLLLTVFNRLVGAATVLDIGANILDTIALMRLSGVQLTKSISVDAALEFYKYAEFNAARNPVLGATSEIVWGFVGAEEDRGNIAAVNGTGNVRELRHRGQLQTLLEPRRVTFADLAPDGVDLVKTDVDGYDHVVIRQNLRVAQALEADALGRGADRRRRRHFGLERQSAGAVGRFPLCRRLRQFRLLPKRRRDDR